MDQAEHEGTLDYCLLKHRPNTTLDPLLQSSHFYTPEDGYTSLWRDGLCPHENTPIDADGHALCDPWEYDKLRRNGSTPALAAVGWGCGGPGQEEGGDRCEGSGRGGVGIDSAVVVQRRRLALQPATVAVDMVKSKFKGMLREVEGVKAPRIHPGGLLLMIIQSQWVESQVM